MAPEKMLHSLLWYNLLHMLSPHVFAEITVGTEHAVHVCGLMASPPALHLLAPGRVYLSTHCLRTKAITFIHLLLDFSSWMFSQG